MIIILSYSSDSADPYVNVDNEVNHPVYDVDVFSHKEAGAVHC